MIDWDRVSELREEIGPDDFGEVVEIFLEEVDDTIQVLAAGGAADQMENVMHFLKGSALNLGFADFADICRRGEAMAAEGSAENISVDEVIQAYRSSRDGFLTGLTSRFAA